jgi:metallo-beta-lactamase family protein
MAEAIKLEFLGGAGTVTGSKTLISTSDHKVMVDCGMFQGLKHLRERNWKKLEVAPVSVEHLILTHAHLDHSGFIPVLVREGFKGEIHCTPSTKRLAELLLLDSAHIQEEDADEANRKKYTRHAPAKPLYTVEDVKACLKLFVTHEYGEWIVLYEDFKFSLHNAGHIAGSAWAEVRCLGKKLVFSGDLGRQHPLLMLPPHRCEEADYLILESTYGNKDHVIEDVEEMLSTIITTTLQKGGPVLIPAFAVERTQEILYLLGKLLVEGRIPKVPIYMDSPMAIVATEIFVDFKFRRPIEPEILEALGKYVEGTPSAKDSKRILENRNPKIVVAGSGMLNGGRILHHLEKHIGNPNCGLIITGYQAEGTRGRDLILGMPEIKFFGQYHKVKASIYQINSLSAHADQGELLLWINRMTHKPKRVFLNHGEPMAADSLRVKIRDQFGIPCEVVEMGRSYLV